MVGRRFRSVKRDLEAIGPAADAIRRRLQDVLDEEGVACVELALVESLTNSILFGAGATRTPIRVFLEVSDTDVVVEIEDGAPPMPELFEGAGQHKLDFDPTDRQTIPEHGRGLSLIVISMDEVTFRMVGAHARLRLVRHRT